VGYEEGREDWAATRRPKRRVEAGSSSRQGDYLVSREDWQTVDPAGSATDQLKGWDIF
jgi:hypothetical protein